MTHSAVIAATQAHPDPVDGAAAVPSRHDVSTPAPNIGPNPAPVEPDAPRGVISSIGETPWFAVVDHLDHTSATAYPTVERAMAASPYGAAREKRFTFADDLDAARAATGGA